ncbi:hypothetical protein DCS_04785 [Drechmeria coniospora]|uniref:Uncharacterized protein n=1 Tax=Drechmeria coniospora TaxID=98403 RepID=A0A151GL90_DRECN|nr:hypothetical protein DCS_04785 [Drechmeria coniospora]KYK57772.1 hypothetical protein DCS_04785 [Drechmeria coniospora]
MYMYMYITGMYMYTSAYGAHYEWLVPMPSTAHPYNFLANGYTYGEGPDHPSRSFSLPRPTGFYLVTHPPGADTTRKPKHAIPTSSFTPSSAATRPKMAAEPSEKATPVHDGDASAPTSSRSVDNDSSDDGSQEKEKQADKLALAKADTKVAAPQPPADDPDEPYRHLPPHQAQILKRQVFTPTLKKGFGDIYRYSSRNDVLILIVSAICAIASGAALPLMTVIFGNLQDTFQQYFYSGGQMTYDDFISEMTKYVLYFVYLAIGEFVVTYICTVGFIYVGEHISAKIREHYLQSCMRQNIGFFDKLGAGEVTTRITSDTNLIQDGISEKVSLTLAAIATFVTAFVIGFISYWKLTLILSSTVFALVFNIGAGSSYMLKNNKFSLESYAQGGSLADEVISSIRNTVAFGTQDRLAKQYDKHLAKAEHYGFRMKSAMAVMVAGMMLILFLNYGLAFWQGSKFLIEGIIPLSKVLIIMMAVMIGAFNLGNVTPNIQAFTTALAAAAKIFNTIDRESPLDPSDDKGDRVENLQGDIRLEHIRHIYPSRPEVVVMDDVSLVIPAGKTTALVGASGSGKSTIVGLVERFYDPVEGSVYLDGKDISTLNLKWLRQQMSLVSQEPTLFGTTIFNNIRHGLIGTKHEGEGEEKQRELVVEAAIKANAHDFITSLPEGYETNVGERGFLLSGGQKQRIAIARAVVSDPKILLLDEATSALDTKSEGVVQAALETAAAGRTTITIAHRLSTIRDAHNIVVMSDGRIVEQGTHDELLEKKSAYWNLVSAQHIATAETMTAEEEEELNRKEEELLVRKMSNKEGGYVADPDDDIAAKLGRTSTQKSASSVALQRGTPEETKKYGVWTLMKVIMSFNKPEWQLMVIGLVFSAICGGGNPFFLCFMAIIFGAQSAGTIFSFAPDMGKAHHAAQELKELFDRQPTIDSWSEEGARLEEVEGHIEFRDVHFRYPTRPQQPVLRGLNLAIRPGQYVALVGASGCGKSTTIALLERFYDPLAGGVFIDGKEISTLNVNDYRSHIALVSQEPTLYQGSIRENILLGTAKEEVSDEDVEFACREANIYDFIVSLPDGFNTVVGSKGALLSGGQKQRIAIARALIRDPRILLLDEATSALDSESEHVVQAALDKAAKGRTTIAVAHRLSTIQKADVIYVFDQGRIVEAGTHSVLMNKNGRYAELVNLQSLAKHG